MGCKSLTMTYFHTGTRTIIGAKSFHCPVRDGKEWVHLAMVVKRKRCAGLKVSFNLANWNKSTGRSRVGVRTTVSSMGLRGIAGLAGVVATQAIEF